MSARVVPTPRWWADAARAGAVASLLVVVALWVGNRGVPQALGGGPAAVSGLTFATDLRPVTVAGRPGELERMVVNVLDNAAKWSPPDGTVYAVLRADGADGTGGADGAGWCRLTVTDSGPGIDEADRPYVFDRFYRATAARSMPGSGLGLAIVAQTVAQHGGTVTAAPHRPHGTVITVRLPSRA